MKTIEQNQQPIYDSGKYIWKLAYYVVHVHFSFVYFTVQR